MSERKDNIHKGKLKKKVQRQIIICVEIGDWCRKEEIRSIEELMDTGCKNSASRIITR